MYFVLYNFLSNSDESCGDPQLTYFAVNHPVTLQPNWEFAETLKLRTFAFLIIYTVLSSLLILFSFACLKRLRYLKHRTPKPLKAFAAWLFIVLLSCCVDVVATGLYAYDITQTEVSSILRCIESFILFLNSISFQQTPQEFLEYLGIETDPLTYAYLSSYEGNFVVPAIIATLFSCRAIILWLLNIVAGIACFNAVRVSSDQIFQTKFL